MFGLHIIEEKIGRSTSVQGAGEAKEDGQRQDRWPAGGLARLSFSPEAQAVSFLTNKIVSLAVL